MLRIRRVKGGLVYIYIPEIVIVLPLILLHTVVLDMTCAARLHFAVILLVRLIDVCTSGLRFFVLYREINLVMDGVGA